MTLAKQAHISYLDGWRGLAIISVLVAHFASITSYWAIGEFGVQLFFALSGYLMGGLLFIKHVPLGDFFARRASRVLPTFFVFVLTMAAFAATLQPKPYVASAAEFLSTVTFLRTYFPDDLSIWSSGWAIGHMWSLNVEEHSYIYLAFGAIVCRALRMKYAAMAFLAASVAAILAINLLYYKGYAPDGASPWALRTEAAALGLIASAAYRVMAASSRRAIPANISPAISLVVFVIGCLCYWIKIPGLLRMTLAPLCLAFAVNNLAGAPLLVRNVLASKWLCWFGLCSFSLYLWQQPFYLAYKQGHIGFVPAITGAIALGAISYYWLESPARLYLNRAWANRDGVSGAIAAPLA